MLQITIQNDESLQITNEFKNKITESISNYIMSHWDTIINIETIDDNHIISIDV